MLFSFLFTYFGVMPIIQGIKWVFCCCCCCCGCERGLTVVWNRLHTLVLLIKMSSFCSKCKRTHPRLRVGSFHRKPRCDFRSLSGSLLVFSTILGEPPLLCLLVLIVSASVTQEWKHVLKCFLATLFVDLRAESWGKTQQQDNHFHLFLWPHFIVSLLCLRTN